MKAHSSENIIVGDAQNTALSGFIHDQFRAMVLSPHYTCVGAKSSFNRNAYQFGLYEDIGSDASTQFLLRDLDKFINVYQQNADFPSTFVASFKTATITSELQFETAIWQQLQKLQILDCLSEWDTAFSDNPESPHFSFSLFKKGFFVVGLHPMSSRWARRFAWPTLVFNSQEQFEQLKDEGTYEKMETVNRRRDEKLQGSINPNIADFGTASEARQYSGRHVEKEWKCPFHRNPPMH